MFPTPSVEVCDSSNLLHIGGDALTDRAYGKVSIVPLFCPLNRIKLLLRRRKCNFSLEVVHSVECLTSFKRGSPAGILCFVPILFLRNSCKA